MRRWLVLLMMYGIASQTWAIDSAPPFADPELQARYQRLAGELRCLVCQNESIADSNAGLAADLRRELREMLAAGKSDEEILTFMTDRYGDFVLFRPPLETRTWLLWGAPLVLLVIALGTVVVVIRRRSQLPVDDSSDLESGSG
jgi:cytochrome c-type biogenesis protein CcmH